MKALKNGILSSSDSTVHRILVLSIKPKYWFSEFDNRHLTFGMVYSIWLSNAKVCHVFFLFVFRNSSCLVMYIVAN